MPRLTAIDYLNHHKALAEVWDQTNGLFSSLSPKQQHDIHHYYRPTWPGTEVQLRAYRRMVTEEDPSLPHRAGRALAVLRRAPEPTVHQPTPARVRGRRHVYTRPVYKSEVDIRLLIQALNGYIENLSTEEREQILRENGEHPEQSAARPEGSR
jgi:hypothetical protein